MLNRSFTLNKINNIDPPPITLTWISLEYSNRMKNLVIVLAENLSWDVHLSVICCQVLAILHKLYRCYKYFFKHSDLFLFRNLFLNLIPFSLHSILNKWIKNFAGKPTWSHYGQFWYDHEIKHPRKSMYWKWKKHSYFRLLKVTSLIIK